MDVKVSALVLAIGLLTAMGPLTAAEGGFDAEDTASETLPGVDEQ